MRNSAPGCAARCRADVLRVDAGVHVALAHPHVDVLAPRHSPNVRAKEHIWKEENVRFSRDRVYDLDGVPGRAAIIALGFDLGRRVDVGHDDGAGMLRLPVTELFGVDGGRQRTAGGEIGQQDALVRREDGRGLGHEVDTAEHDGLRLGLRGFAAQSERVADEVRDVLDLRALVVVREDDRVPALCQCANTVVELGIGMGLDGQCH